MGSLPSAGCASTGELEREDEGRGRRVEGGPPTALGTSTTSSIIGSTGRTFPWTGDTGGADSLLRAIPTTSDDLEEEIELMEARVVELWLEFA
jgi:hypothetical protein